MCVCVQGGTNKLGTTDQRQEHNGEEKNTKLGLDDTIKIRSYDLESPSFDDEKHDDKFVIISYHTRPIYSNVGT